jgi:hypothetical protein
LTVSWTLTKSPWTQNRESTASSINSAGKSKCPNVKEWSKTLISHQIQKNQLKKYKDLNVWSVSIKPPEGNMREKICDIDLGRGFLDMTLKS